MVWKILNGLCAINFDVLFNLAPATGTRGHPYKLAHAHVNVDARRRFFSQRVIKKWNSLSVATVMSETLGEFERRLEDDLGEKLYEINTMNIVEFCWLLWEAVLFVNFSC